MVENVSHLAPGCRPGKDPAVACLARRTGVIATEPDVPVPDSAQPGTTRGRGSVPGMAAQRFRGPVLPDGEARDLYVVDGPSGGVVTYEPQAGAETVAEGWIVPGLVDAHCHVGLDENGAVDDETSEQQAITDRDAGALLLRDCGSAADTSWIHDREDLPRLVRAGRHIARTKRYIRNYAHEVEPAELPAYVAQEAQRGDGWVKLVGDWIDRDAGDLDAVLPGRRVRRGHPASRTSTAPRSPPTASARRCCRG